MTYLLLQTFLLLLSAYFAGAFCACLTKRALMTRSVETAAVAARTAPAVQVEYPEEIVPLVKPREIDPVQPRIEVFPRPARKVVPVEGEIDISRFNRALTGPEFNEGMPRKMIVELRPAILKSPTGPAVPSKKPEPKVEAPKVEAPKADATKPAAPVKAPEPAKPVAAAPAPAKPEPPKADVKDAKPAAPSTQPDKPAAPPVEAKLKTDAPAKEAPASTGASPMMAGIAGASAAAAAAVAAAKAAAASVVPRAQPAQPSTPTSPPADKPSPDKPNVDKFAPDKPMSAEPAAPKAETATIKPAPAPAPAPTPAAAQPAPPKPAAAEPAAKPEPQKTLASQPAQVPAATPPMTGGDDLLRIRAIDTQTVASLNGIGINRFEQIAHWTPADVNRVNQTLGLSGRVDREQWIEQAQILAKGGETYYSRNRGAIVRSAAEPPPPAAEKPATAQPEATPAKPAAPAPTPSPAASPVATPPPASAPAPQAAAEKPAAPPQATPTQQAPSAAAPVAPAAPPSPTETAPPAPSMTAAMQGKSVAEMATAAAAAIAAASASVTRGIRPIEPISPLARANPNIVMPAKLSDAIKDKESKAPAEPAAAPASAPVKPSGKADDLKRIRGIGVLIEKRLNAIGITTYEQVANWTAADIDRISQMLEFKGRIERESWVEHARILMSGGETEFSRRVDRGDVETSRDDS